MKKRIVALILCLVMLVPFAAGCSKEGTDEDKGAIIPVYITNPIYNLDPAIAYTNDEAAKLICLLFEGVTRINSSGKVEKAMAKSWETIEKAGEYKLQITLKSSKWSDGREVSADDFIYAWKRVLDPEFTSEAASLLFDIKNARLVKSGDASIDDLGLAAVDSKVIEVTFETKINYDQFLLNLASPALVPLREDIVVRSDDWAKKASTIVTNGPFLLRTMDYGKKMTLERCAYYLRDTDKGDSLIKYVRPYRLVVIYEDDLATQLEKFNNGEIFYIGDIPLAERANYKNKVTTQDLLSTHSYYFNLSNPLFEKAEVRRALSLALDRNEIVNLVVFAKPATGLVPYGVFNATSSKDSFRSKAGGVISASANLDEAKSLLASAGVSGGSFAITVKGENEVDIAIAQYAKGVWESLGFTVNIKKIEAIETMSGYYNDKFTTAYYAGDFDVIAIDMQALTADAFGVLAPFAKEFSGHSIDMENKNYDLQPHVTGYDSEAYNAKIEEAFAEKDIAKRASILAEAEKILLDDMPVIPVVFNVDAYMVNKKFSKVKSLWFGARYFNDAKLSGYEELKPGYEELGY